MAVDPLSALRDIALAFPEAVEKEAWGHPTFRVRDKIFVSYGEDVDTGQPVVTCKAAPGEQASLLAHGEPFFKPRYVGDKGWIGVRLDDETDWNEIAELVLDSFRGIAPKSLSKGIGVAQERSAAVQAVVRVGNVIGEIVEGKPPKDQSIAVAEADDDLDSGLKLTFDPDDPKSTSIDV